MIRTLQWTGEALRLLDQTLLPTQTVYVDLTDEKQTWDAIKRLVVRGAPAIGVAAAFGVYLGVRNASGDVMGRVNEVCDYLATSRPTAVNLFWAIERIRKVATASSTDQIKQNILAECQKMAAEDSAICRAIGEQGYALLQKLPRRDDGSLGLLTHCNAGALATVEWGTALAPMFVAHERGMKLSVFADETRPLLQGSRITAFELQQANIPVTVICDNMAATVMSQKKVQAVIVGTDRVAANGDVANKIGTMGVAILAKHFGIPFYVACPTSTIDLSLATGAQIPIEERAAEEITRGMGKQTAPTGVNVFNPAFDVTPNELVTAIITEHGIAQSPYKDSLRGMLRTDR